MNLQVIKWAIIYVFIYRISYSAAFICDIGANIPSIIQRGPVEIWFNTEDWTRQPVYGGGHNEGIFCWAFYDLLDTLRDLEEIARELVEMVVEVVRLVICTIMALTLGKLGDARMFEYPQANLVLRFKREHLADTLADATWHEFKLVRCVKRIAPAVWKGFYQVPKAFYYFFPFGNKCKCFNITNQFDN